MDGLHFFEPKQDFTVAWKTLPHWSQAGTVCFVTWRTADSLPKSAIERLARERAELLTRYGVDPQGDRFSEKIGYGSRVSPKLDEQLAKLSPEDRARLHWQLFNAWDRQLDLGAGECVLARPELSAFVAESLQHFDGERYVLTDFVVMPNHVHVLVAFADEEALLAQVASWKRFAARQINDAIGRRGEFWQVEQFDYLGRSFAQLEYLRTYVAENPHKARLGEQSYRWYSKAL